MDQLKKAWAVLARHHFWVLIVVTTLIAAYCWYSGATALSEQFKANKSKIDQGFTSIAGVRGLPFKANADVNEKQEAQISIQKKQVHEMWQELYDRQRAEVLKWPSNLSDQFRNTVEGMKFLDEIPRDLRDHYNNYVRDHFPDLPKIVGAKLAAEGEAGSYSRGGGGGRGSFRGGMMEGRGEMGPGVGGAQGAVDEEEYLVDWLDQDRIRQQLYVPSTPSSKRIWKTQEDVWVYEALLKIIAATNKAANADRNSNAAVRAIEVMEVGQPAAQQSRSHGRIEMVQAPAAGGEMGGEMGSDMMGRGAEMAGPRGGGDFGGGDMMGGGERGGMGAAGEGDVDLFTSRYIDAQGQPIAGEDPASFGKEFKRLPVRMQLVMDERWLPQLISECANAALQVDVQEVRINPAAEGSSGYSGGSRGGMSMGGQAGEPMVPEAEPAVKTVILQGIIYIFNPPTDAAGPGQVAGVQ